MNELFFELLQVAIGKLICLSRTPSEDEWKELYNMAKKQSLVGVCFAGVQKTLSNSPLKGEDPTVIGMPGMLYLTWMGMAAKIQQRNEVVNRQCVELQERLKTIGYRSCVLKGQSAAKLYIVSEGFNEFHGGSEGSMDSAGSPTINHKPSTTNLQGLRQSGDIDAWVDAPRKEIIEMVQKIAPTTNVREHHLELQCFSDAEVEVHFWPAVIRHFRKNRKLQRWFEGKREEVFEKGEPTSEFHAIQMMAHMYHHLFDSGIGLRQVMDYYFVLNAIANENNREFLRSSRCSGASGVPVNLSVNTSFEAIKHIGMGRFAAAMMWVLQETMGLEREKMICEPSEEDGKFLLGEIMRGGNFGHHDDRKTRNTKNYLSSFIGGITRNFRYLRFNPFDWFWSPMWRIYYFCWRKLHGYH